MRAREAAKLVKGEKIWHQRWGEEFPVTVEEVEMIPDRNPPVYMITHKDIHGRTEIWTHLFYKK